MSNAAGYSAPKKQEKPNIGDLATTKANKDDG